MELIESWINRLEGVDSNKVKKIKPSNHKELYENARSIVEKYSLMDKDRSDPVTFRRFYFMYHLRNKVRFSLNDSGTLLDKNHSHVIHAVKKHLELLGNPSYELHIHDIREEMNRRCKIR
jgi:chromosomal replication initiation ATPase DnaA